MNPASNCTKEDAMTEETIRRNQRNLLIAMSEKSKLDNLYKAKAVKGIMTAADALTEALAAAQMGSNNTLFSQIHEQQMKLWELASTIIGE